jgi:hypothetical protein
MALNALNTINELDNAGNQMGVITVPRGLDLYRPKAEGEVTLIIVPYVTTDCPLKSVKPGDMFYCRDYFVFRGLGASKKERCLDNKRTFNERCAITESLADWAGDPKQKPRSQRMCLFNVYFPDSDKVMLMDFSYTNFAEALFEAVQLQAKRNGGKKAFIANFADPVEGSTITFSWKEDSYNGNKFFVASNFDFDQHGGLSKDVLDKAANLDKALVRLTFSEVSAMFLGENPDDMEPKQDVPMGMAAPATTTAPEPEVTTKAPDTTKAPEPEAAPKTRTKKASAETPVVGSIVYYEGKKCVIKKIAGDVITIAETEDDDERYKVGAADITSFPPTGTKAEPKAPKDEPKAAPSKMDDAFDSDGWDD